MPILKMVMSAGNVKPKVKLTTPIRGITSRKETKKQKRRTSTLSQGMRQIV
jgi:hypothetical protein